MARKQEEKNQVNGPGLWSLKWYHGLHEFYCWTGPTDQKQVNGPGLWSLKWYHGLHEFYRWTPTDQKQVKNLVVIFFFSNIFFSEFKNIELFCMVVVPQVVPRAA